MKTLISIMIAVSLLVTPAASFAQTSVTNYTPEESRILLIATLQQLIVLLTQQLNQLIAERAQQLGQPVVKPVVFTPVVASTTVSTAPQIPLRIIEASVTANDGIFVVDGKKYDQRVLGDGNTVEPYIGCSDMIFYVNGVADGEAITMNGIQAVTSRDEGGKYGVSSRFIFEPVSTSSQSVIFTAKNQSISYICE